jgi:hypothetical protein
MTHSRLLKTAGTAGACAAVGVIAGIAGSAAAPANSSSRPPGIPSGTVTTRLLAPPGVAFFKLGAGGPAVHAVQIVPNRTGDGFDTVTQDAGIVKAVSGDRLTITEGTDKATYATPTLTVVATATVERNFKNAKLADIQVGDHVDVTATAGGSTNVFAIDSQHWPPKPATFTTKGGPIPAPPLSGSTASAGVAYGFTGP